MTLPFQLDLSAVNAMAPSTASAIQSAAKLTRGEEAQFAVEMDDILAGIARRAGLQWDSSTRVAERRVAWLGKEGTESGFIDRLLFNRVVVEYKSPGSLRTTNDHTANRYALEQIRQYMAGLIEKEGHHASSIAGVVTDGHYFVFSRYSGEQWIEEAPLSTDEHSVGRFLRLLLTFRKDALLPDSVMQRFGEESDHTAELVNALYEALKAPQEPITQALLAQWEDYFADVAGLDPNELPSKLHLMEFARRVTRDANVDPSRLLFALYTYSALLVKLLTVAAILPFVDPHKADEIEKWSQFGSEPLRKEFEKIEAGELFARHVTNFTEGDFFGWYVKEWTDNIHHRLTVLISSLAEYDFDVVEQAPERVRDLLKSLYHGLFPREVRHDLGEYYTPDWLAERLLRRLDSDLFCDISEKASSKDRQEAAAKVKAKLTSTTFVDPACGSGTFLVLIIRRLRQWARECGLNERQQLLPALFSNIYGFDLNPLAVISSRANFLLAVADLLDGNDEPRELPIYLADSVATPEKGDDVLYEDCYRLPLRGLNGGNSGKPKEPKVVLPIPMPIAEKRPQLRLLTEILSRDVPKKVSPEVFIRACEKSLGLSAAALKRYRPVLRELYTTLLELHKQRRDGIWANIARNMFMPLFLPQVDYVIGNPPWVNWESLPAHYREHNMALWEKYGLFVHSGMDTILGKGKKDVSTLMTYVAADRYLKPGGRLGFVITQSVFKSSGAGQGFRRFILPDGTPLKVVAVEDYSAMQPFEGATNRTTLVVLVKGKKTDYPVPYLLVRKKGRASIPYAANLKQAAPLLTETEIFAQPVDPLDSSSAWITAGKRALRAMEKMLGASDYQAHAGAYSGGANAVYWLKLLKRNPDGTVKVRNVTEGAKRAVKQEDHVIEPDYLFPLLRGRDVRKWRAVPEPDAMFLVVQDPLTRRGFTLDILRANAERTLKYLEQYRSMLEERAAYKRYFSGKAEFYSMFNIAPTTFADYKVVWAEQGKFECAVVRSTDARSIVPDHKVMLIPADDIKEAHFICALANSKPYQCAVRAYSIETQQDPHVLQNVRIPRFKPKDKWHVKLAELSLEAHEIAAKTIDRPVFVDPATLKRLSQVEDEIDILAGKVWNLSQEELDDIRISLAELR